MTWQNVGQIQRMNSMQMHKYSVSKQSLRKGRVGLELCSPSICFYITCVWESYSPIVCGVFKQLKWVDALSKVWCVDGGGSSACKTCFDITADSLNEGIKIRSSTTALYWMSFWFPENLRADTPRIHLRVSVKVNAHRSRKPRVVARSHGAFRHCGLPWTC